MMARFSILLFAFLSIANESIADAVCRLEIQESRGTELTAVLTKTADAAAVEYSQPTKFLYPFKYDCKPSGTRVCVTEKPWSLHVISFEFLPYAITASVLDRNAYGTAETEINIRMWRVVDCTGDLEFD